MDKTFNSVEQANLINLLLQAQKDIEELKRQFLATSLGSKIITYQDIDAKVLATTTLVPVPVGKTLVVTRVIVRSSAFTVGSKSVQAVANLGNNSTAFDNYLSGKTFTVSADGQYRIVTKDDTLLSSFAGGTNFSLKVTTASNATVEKWDVDVFGYYI